MLFPTPRPWRYISSHEGYEIRASDNFVIMAPASGTPATEADAIYIVKCVNMHEDLIRTLNDLATLIPPALGRVDFRTITDLTVLINRAGALLKRDKS